MTALRGLLLGLVSGALLLSQPGAAWSDTKHHKSTTASARHASAKAHRTHQTQKTNPNRADRPLIVIDPGHGGRDPGAIGVSGTLEKTVTLATALALQRSLEATGRYRVALTRTGDRTVSLAERLAFARKHDADLLIAIHADASPDKHVRGASVYVRHALPRLAGEARAGSTWLQDSMIEQLSDDVRMTAAPARNARLYVLAARDTPSVLVEIGFLSNRQDERLIKQPANRRVLVQAISDAIDDYFAALRHSASRT